jgi:hypothetical protein
MRTRQLLLVTVMTTVFVSMGCQSEDQNPLQAELESSRAGWRELVRAQGETYSYSQSTESWTTYKTRTAQQIQDGVVTYRRFESNTPNPGGQPPSDIVLRWEERGAEIGSHIEGFAPATVDQLYDRCRDEVLTQDPKTNDITLVFQDHNVLGGCGYVPHGCVDDCWMGVSVGEFAWGLKY